MSAPDTCLIWSNEHRAWWGKGERGYVHHILDAGRYPRERALEIVRNAQFGRQGGDPPPEIVVREEDAMITLSS